MKNVIKFWVLRLFEVFCAIIFIIIFGGLLFPLIELLIDSLVTLNPDQQESLQYKLAIASVAALTIYWWAKAYKNKNKASYCLGFEQKSGIR